MLNRGLDITRTVLNIKYNCNEIEKANLELRSFPYERSKNRDK